MIVPVVVEGQSLRWYGRIPEIADNSIEFVQLEFRFPEDWDNMVIVAQFTQTKTYNCLLVNNRCFLPMELVAGPCEVSVFGYLNEEVTRGTTIPLKLNISRSGFVSSAETPIPPTPDLYAQLIEYFSSIAGSGGGGSGSGTINPEDIAAAVEDYLSKNPPEVPDLSDEVTRAETAASEAEAANKNASASANNAGSYATYARDSATSAASSAALADEAASDAEAAAARAEEAAKVTTDLDTTLTQAGKAADAKAVGDAISKLSGGNALYVFVNKDMDGTLTVDRTNAEIYNAFLDNKAIYCVYSDMDIPGIVLQLVAGNEKYCNFRCHIIEMGTLSVEITNDQVSVEFFEDSGGDVDLSGYVKSVNGNAPDENGNVEITIPDSGGNVDYVLPVGGDELGGVKNGGNVVINADGTMTAPESTKLPVANTAALGGVKPTVAKSAVMTQPVAVDENGGMWTTAAASGTVLVAASDAPDTIKAAAQYVCTGVNDQLMINAAIETVGEGEVRLSGGNFYLTGGIIPKDRIILYGRNSVLNVCDEISSTVTQAYTAGDTVIHVADASVFVVGQKVSTDANLFSTYPCFIVGIDVANNTVTLDNALSTAKGFDANIYRLIADFTVVHCDGLSNVTVEGLVINGNSDSYGFYDTDRGSNGILFMYCEECKAINCTMNNVKCHGILVYRSTQCQVLNCVVDSCPRLGIDIYGAPGGHLIHGCIAKNCPSTGIQGHNVVNTIFSNCTATNCGTGISAQEGPNNVVITGCELYGNRYGIKCIAAGAKTLNIVGNTILSSAIDGIQLDATNAIDLCVSNNIIKDSAHKAIWLLGANGFSIVGNHIGNSFAANTGTTITDNAAIAIYGAAKNGYVADNNIILTTSDTKGCACGIAECSFTGDKNVVVNNVIRGARIAATQKLGANSKFENNYEF